MCGLHHTKNGLDASVMVPEQWKLPYLKFWRLMAPHMEKQPFWTQNNLKKTPKMMTNGVKQAVLTNYGVVFALKNLKMTFEVELGG